MRTFPVFLSGEANIVLVTSLLRAQSPIRTFSFYSI